MAIIMVERNCQKKAVGRVGLEPGSPASNPATITTTTPQPPKTPQICQLNATTGSKAFPVLHPQHQKLTACSAEVASIVVARTRSQPWRERCR